MKNKAVAVFGGSFNPPTVAHIKLAKQILKNIEDIEKVIYIPVSTKYNKNGLASDEDRFNMLQTICENEKNIEVSSIELDTSRQLYTIETLNILQQQNPKKQILFVIGTDNLKEIETWHKADELLEKYKIIVLERNSDNMEKIIESSKFLMKNKKSFIKLQNIEKIDLSASYVRDLIKKNKKITGLVPINIEKKVYDLYN